MRDVSQKLRRLLFIVPYVAKRQEGVPVEQLAELLGVDRDELLHDLELLSQVGPPDGDPGEYLLVSVDEGRVFVELAHRLTRPLRLTAAEGCSLLLGIRALRESGIAPFDDAMQSAERKLLVALGRDASEAESLATSTIVAEPDPATARHLRELVVAARTNKRVEIGYASASRHQAEQRPIDPYGIVHHAGEWYVVAFCHKRGDVRTFRIDRIAELRSTGEAFERPETFDLEAYRRERLYVPSADAVTVRVRLDAVAVNRIGASWPVGEVTMHDDGAAELLVDCEGMEWVTGWVLQLGRHAEILEPREAREAMRVRIARIRAELA
ncbi:MAG: WYL domain-containing protein [Proteobacteria bacterium]|nr:WYL domain-containing protein [Pseudomonadota bacterium]